MHRSGFINIIGNPNVGKSTLMNNLVGEKLSIITSKAQTTRHRILGIVNGENFQLIFSDTPGIIKPSYELQDSMMDFVKSALEDADVILYMVEIGEKSIKDSEVHNKIISPENVVFTPGAKPIMFFTIMALIEPGDEVIYPNPGFPIYESMINYVGG